MIGYRSVPLLLLVASVTLPLEAQTRHWRTYKFVREGGISAEGDPLLAPLKAVADDSTLYVVDNGDRKLKAFGWNGTLRWTFGRQGSGPGEFRSITSLSRARDGSLWIYDQGNSRIAVVSPGGKLVREIRPGRYLLPGGAIPLDDGGFVAQTGSDSAFLSRFSASGTLTSKYPVPPDIAGRNAIESHSIGDRGVGGVVFTAYGTDRFYTVSETGKLTSYRGVQPMEFPGWYAATATTASGKKIAGMRPSADNESGSIGAILEQATVLVLMGSVTAAKYRTIDVYEMPSGRYRESFLLPAPCQTVFGVAGRIVCLQVDPAPQVHIWQRLPTPGK